MLIRTILSTCFCLSLFVSLQAQTQTRIDYIEKYKDIAIQEMERAGIPASIKLAQGILESNAGQSSLAKRANNHFGIKCGNDWNGKKIYKEDDDYDEQGQLTESCFRSYKSGEASFIAHSEFLRDPNKQHRYGFLFRIDPRDYKRWAYGLKQSGYATSATYHTKLIDVIESYGLSQYDEMSSLDLVTSTDAITGVLVNNDVRYVLSQENETLSDIARRTDTTLRSLLKYNELVDEGSDQLAEGTKVYIQPKRGAYRGKKTWHYVKDGESMFDISQLYGVKLARLYSRNKIPVDSRPAIGERLKLRGWCKVKERPLLASEAKDRPEMPMPELIIDGEDDGELDMDDGEEMEMDNEGFDDGGIRPEDDIPNLNNEPDFQEVPVEDNSNEDIPSSPINPPPPVINPPTNPTPVNPPVTNPPPVPDEPVFEDVEIEEPVQPKDPVEDGLTYHTVQSGDTLYSISRTYNTTVDAIKEFNNLNSNTISIGQKLRVK